MASQARAVLWDLGHTLVDWNPARVYRELLPDDDAVEAFLGGVCTMAWHSRHDAGVPMAENRKPLIAAHPDKADLIRAWDERWPDMFDGWVDGMEALVEDLESAGVPQFALTNLPAEKWPHIQATYPAIARFQTAVVSGREKLIKPDPRIYQITAERISTAPGETVFVDDRAENIEAARREGFLGVVFKDAETTRAVLRGVGLPV
ncbi:MAG: HAD family phosphatase [Oceanicaulis sp.]